MRIPIPALLLLAACASPGEQAVIQQARDRVFPAVVFIKPIQEEFRGGEKTRVQIFGSGAIISPEGYVVTNNHVAEKAAEIKCVLSDKEELPATVVGLDPETDLAVLRIDLTQRKSRDPLPSAAFGDASKVQEGDLVMAMGAPHGLERSISRGIVSATERFFDFAPYNLFFQTDAAINPGNSGGPLVNEKGEIIGINTLGMRGGENLGFAIPADVAREVVDELIRRHAAGEKDAKVLRAWSGIRFQALKDFTKSTYVDSADGVLIASVDEGSPAEDAGLRAGDVIRSLEGAPVTGQYETHLPAVERRFAKLEIGKPVRLEVARGRETLTVTLTPAKRGKKEGDEFEAKKWGLTVKEITKFSDPFLHFMRARGVYVLGIKRTGNAAASGLQPYDILVKIEDAELKSLRDFEKAFETALAREKGSRKVLVRILRTGYPRSVVLDFEIDREDKEE